jgi:hypothetical protein
MLTKGVIDEMSIDPSATASVRAMKEDREGKEETKDWASSNVCSEKKKSELLCALYLSTLKKGCEARCSAFQTWELPAMDMISPMQRSAIFR